MVKLRKKLSGAILIILIGIIIIILLHSMPISAEEVNKLPKKHFDMVPFYWIVGIVGGCIAATLTYVSWQKYKTEEKKQTKTDRNN